MIRVGRSGAESMAASRPPDHDKAAWKPSATSRAEPDDRSNMLSRTNPSTLRVNAMRVPSGDHANDR
jgi:hypothetical protein